MRRAGRQRQRHEAQAIVLSWWPNLRTHKPGPSFSQAQLSRGKGGRSSKKPYRDMPYLRAGLNEGGRGRGENPCEADSAWIISPPSLTKREEADESSSQKEQPEARPDVRFPGPEEDPGGAEDHRPSASEVRSFPGPEALIDGPLARRHTRGPARGPARGSAPEFRLGIQWISSEPRSSSSPAPAVTGTTLSHPGS